MKRGIRNALVAFGIGTVVTLALFAAGSVAYRQGYERTSRVLYWQGPALQSLVPGLNIGTPDHPVIEATPVHVALFYAGIPVGFVVYGLLGSFAISLAQRRRAG